jgi:hypothetical protein
MTAKEFDNEAFYAALERSVKDRGATWKALSQVTGVSQTTLTRMGQGRKPDAASLATLSAWAKINPAHYVAGIDHAESEGPSTLEQIALAVRRDVRLSDAAKQQLMTIVESTYGALATPPAAAASPGNVVK